MLARRIIPQLLVDGKKLIKGRRFDGWRSVGVVMPAVKVHQQRQVDEIMILDIAATPEKRGPDLDMISNLASETFSPLTVGGGIRTVDDVRDLLRHGADKVCVGTAAMRDKRFVCAAANKFGISTLVGAIDYKIHHGVPLVYIRCGTHPLLVRPEQAAMQMEECGIGEILLTCIDREGTMEGYDIETILEVTESVSIPVIAAGGCAGYGDMFNAILCGADAVSAGALFQFTDSTPQCAAQWLKDAGVEVRCA